MSTPIEFFSYSKYFFSLFLQTGLCAYFIRDWRYLHFATAGLIIPQLLLWWWVPESPRWLITRRKWRKFSQIARKREISYFDS